MAHQSGNELLPTILMFKPTEFEVVPDDKLEEWEQHLREDVGLDLVTLAADRRGRGTTSRSGRPPEKDDCDVQ